MNPTHRAKPAIQHWQPQAIIPARCRSAALLILAAAALLGGCGGGSSGAGNAVEAPTYSVGGTLSGLAASASVSLTANGGSPMQIERNGSFTFPQAFKMNASYTVAVANQPSGQICSISSASATISGHVTNVLVSCVTPPPVNTTLTLGGIVSGMSAGTQLGLLNNGTGLQSINANAPYAFVANAGTSYAVSVAKNPAGQLCAVSNADGIAATDVSNIAVTCHAAQLSIVTGSGGGPGRSDGIGANARFNRPQGNAVDSAGNVFVADWNNQSIRKITPNGIVTTFAGAYRVTGSADGVGVNAQFCRPLGIAIDRADFLYVTDTCNETIRKISPAGVVTTFAGVAGMPGSADGTGAQARFKLLAGIAIDSAGTLYVADYGNGTIRKVSPGGVVSTLAGTAGEGGSQDGPGGGASFAGVNGIAVDSQGYVYVADTYNHLVRKITPDGVVSTLAGTLGTRGNVDGQGSAAAFSFATPQGDDWGQPPLSGMVVDRTGTLLLTDYFNNTIRSVSPTGLVETVVGRFSGAFNGQGASARLRTPTGISIDASGNFYVSEDYNWTIRKISPSWLTSTMAGKTEISGSTNGVKGVASFNSPYAAAADAAGNLYVADHFNSVIRKVSADGVTSTFAGSVGVIGTTDGIGSEALFNRPSGIAVDADGNVFVSDYMARTIRKITPDGRVTTLAGEPTLLGSHVDGTGREARFNFPGQLGVDAAGNVYVADFFNSAVRKITPAGVVTTVGGGRIARGLNGVAVDAAGNVYYSSTYGHIKKITPDGKVVLLAGVEDSTGGSIDGFGPAARFSIPGQLAVDAKGNVYVTEDCTIRMVTAAGAVSTIVGVKGQCETHEGAVPALLPPLGGIALTPDGKQLVLTGNGAILRVTGF